MNKVLQWNKGLSIISIVNLLFLVYYYFSYDMKSIEKKMYILVFIYALVCSIRSIWPRLDNERICLHDNFMSKPIIGRTLATIAELSFAYLLLIFTKQIIDFTKLDKNLSNMNLSTFFLIVFAQIMCWVGVITKDTLWNALEESTWTVFALIFIYIYGSIFKKVYNVNAKNKKLLMISKISPIIIILFIFYIIFMVNIDIPMYIRHSKEYKGKILNLMDGLKELSICKKTTSLLKYWKDDIPWMSGYFTIAVWFSIYLLLWTRKFTE